MIRLVIFIISLSVCSLTAADTIRIIIKGAACSPCASSMEKAFKAQPQVKTVDVDLDNNLVTIQTRTGHTFENAKLNKLVGNAGYTIVRIVRQK